MDVYSVIQNLAIGITSGIFSGVIVSVVFYILGNYQNEIDDAQNTIMPLYEVITLDKVREKCGLEDISEYLAVIRANVDTVALNLNPSKYNYQLRQIMFDISEIISDGKFFERNGRELVFNEKMLHEFAVEVESQLKLLRECEGNFGRGLTERIIKNKAIWFTGAIAIIIIVIALLI